MKPQTPVTPPRYRFRPRNDHYTMPRFRDGEPPRLHAERYETEPEPMTLADLKDPSVWVGGGLMFAAICVFVLLSGLIDVTP